MPEHATKDPRSTIWLVGMMGAGKSAVGLALAARLRREFVDTDAEVEREAGVAISEIFDREGEAAFRERERRAIESVAGRPVVAALGGGALSQPGMSARLASTGTLVYLRARPQTLLDRVGEATERPLLAGLDRAARLARLGELLASREAAYAAAPVVVDTDECGVDGVVDAVARGVTDS